MLSLCSDYNSPYPSQRETRWGLFYAYIYRNTKPTVSQYLSPFLPNPITRISEYQKFPSNSIIPTISYNPQTTNFSTGILSSQLAGLSNFESVAYRLFINHFQPAFLEMSRIVRPEDIVILDLDDSSHTTPFLSSYYRQISALKAKVGCRTVLVRSALNNLTNVGLQNGLPIASADNSLLTMYANYGFDAFGDFAGTKKDELRAGGSVSPGLIYYDWNSNSYYGFNSGAVRHVSQFQATIVPALINSPAWTNYSGVHHTSCPGCITVNQVSTGALTGNTQAMWKGVSISHYLHTMEEFL